MLLYKEIQRMEYKNEDEIWHNDLNFPQKKVFLRMQKRYNPFIYIDLKIKTLHDKSRQMIKEGLEFKHINFVHICTSFNIQISKLFLKIE